MKSEALHICVDDYPGEKIFDPIDVPDLINPRATSREELALAKFKMWEVGQELRIRFLDGTPNLHQRVIRYATQWLNYANLEFNFGNHVEAEIRITFQGSGYRSLVGTDALLRSAPWSTMTLGGLDEETEQEIVRRVVLHEFGHAIGCVHEQSNPSIDIPWDKKKVYEFYANYGWDKEKVDRNVLKRYSKSDVEYTHHDPASIMQYPVHNDHTIGDFEISWNTELSETDKAFIYSMYPY